MAPGSDTVRRSKLHLVDLAGSERPSQTGVEASTRAAGFNGFESANRLFWEMPVHTSRVWIHSSKRSSWKLPVAPLQPCHPAQGKLLQEATAINMSLFYLERVIVALHERSQGKGTPGGRNGDQDPEDLYAVIGIGSVEPRHRC